MKINESSKSVKPKGDDKSEDIAEIYNNDVTIIPMGVNSLIQSTTTTNIPPTSPSKDEIWLDFCNLTDIDPWDSTIIEFVKPQKDHMINCTPKIFEHSKLINGQLYLYSNESINDEEMGCEMRCLFVVYSKRINYGNWIEVVNGIKPECDVNEI
jgi:hypothetical protein